MVTGTPRAEHCTLSGELLQPPHCLLLQLRVPLERLLQVAASATRPSDGRTDAPSVRALHPCRRTSCRPNSGPGRRRRRRGQRSGAAPPPPLAPPPRRPWSQAEAARRGERTPRDGDSVGAPPGPCGSVATYVRPAVGSLTREGEKNQVPGDLAVVSHSLAPSGWRAP